MTKLPEPDTHCFDTDTGLDVWSYSKEQMLQFLRDALEEAARVCDNAAKPEPLCRQTDEEFACSWCADAIRNLKDET